MRFIDEVTVEASPETGERLRRVPSREASRSADRRAAIAATAAT
jgi:hypothetical protein